MTPAMTKALEIWTAPTATPNESPEAFDARRIRAKLRASLTSDDWAFKVFAFNFAMDTLNGIGPSPLPKAVIDNEMNMLFEELQETATALRSHDLIEALDGLLDLCYVALGTALKIGYTPEQINAAMQEIHASNMSKVDKNGNPVYNENGKVIKSDQYIPVDLPAAINT